jgi:hypothetical protein
LPGLVGAKMAQRGQREIRQRQPGARSDRRDFGPERGGGVANPRGGPRGKFRELFRAQGSVRAEQQRVNERGGVERLVSGGLDLAGERVPQLLGIAQMQPRGLAQVGKHGGDSHDIGSDAGGASLGVRHPWHQRKRESWRRRFRRPARSFCFHGAFAALPEFAIPTRIDGADALVKRRVGGQRSARNGLPRPFPKNM